MDTLSLARELIRRPSVSPADAGCQALIAELLQSAGFLVEHLKFGETDNLWARRGRASPALVFAGHTDVVPTGPPDQWDVEPFAATVWGDRLIGRCSRGRLDKESNPDPGQVPPTWTRSTSARSTCSSTSRR